MAHLFRLIAALALLAIGSLAHAVVPKIAQYYNNVQGSTVLYSTAQLACTALQAQATTYFHNNVGGSGAFLSVVTPVGAGSSNPCMWQGPSGPVAYQAVTSTGASACPANSTVSGSSCVCTSPYVEDSTHTSCVAPLSDLEQFCQSHAALKNPFNQSGTIGASSALPAASCYKPYPPFSGSDAARGCAMTLNNTIAVPRENDPLLKDWSATGVATGATCEDAVATDAAPKAGPNPCPDGFAGSVNGQTVCVKREPDKGIEGVQGTNTTNADGTSTTTKETTKCNAGVCTTTKETTNRDAAGAIVGTVKTDTKAETIGAKCNADPGNKVCATTGTGVEGGGGLTGDCVAGFVVKGEDPILNAMALEQYKRNCEVLRTDTEPSAWVTAEGQKTGNAMDGNPNNGTVNIGPGNFDQSDALGGGGCSLNKTVVVRGYSVALPFNVLCDPLAVLGQILVAVSLLLAARIVTRG